MAVAVARNGGAAPAAVDFWTWQWMSVLKHAVQCLGLGLIPSKSPVTEIHSAVSGPHNRFAKEMIHCSPVCKEMVLH